MSGTLAIVRSRYETAAYSMEGNGGIMLRGIPKRKPWELKEIKRILSSYHCRRCAKCCRGFGITPADPNYEKIMGLIAERKWDFALKKDHKGFKLEQTEVLFPMGKSACGFLNAEPGGRRLPAWALEESDGREGGEFLFGCGIYGNRPSICNAYPIYPELQSSERKGERALKPMALDGNCAAIWELFECGIGHISINELEELGREAQTEAPESLLAGLRNSLAEAKRRLSEDFGWGEMPKAENGEEILLLQKRDWVNL